MELETGTSTLVRRMQEPEAPEPAGEGSDSSRTKLLRQRIENNLIVILGVVLFSGVGIGWAVSEKLRVEPRDFENNRLQALLNERRMPDAAQASPELPVLTRDTQTRLEIVEPADGDTVDIEETIKGTSSRVPAGNVIWVAIYSHRDQKYYPHEYRAIVDSEGRWTSPDTPIGAGDDLGRTFEILVLLVDSTGMSDLEEYRRRLDRSGMDGLPSAVPHDRVIVIRR